MTVTVFIDGAEGTTGLEIRERLAGRPEIALITLDESARKDAARRREALNDADVAILCLPDDAARAAVAMVTRARTVIIDASTAHRTAPGWTYGFPEIDGAAGAARLAAARRISNPGCYPTGFLALVAPLAAAGLLPRDWPFCVNAVSGYSGGGKAMIAEFESASPAPPAWRAYALSLAHKHLPEMQHHAGLTMPPLFAPSVANVYRGMVVEVPLPLAAMPGKPSAKALREALAAHYRDAPLVRVGDEAPTILPIEAMAGRDTIKLHVLASDDGGQARLVALLDNLGKGAAGAAVQSLNLVAGFPETTGLRLW